ncbi:HAD-IA family hydrolase [Roseobacter sp.]|uniref:HAD-IA family hydrolase n=1 Tax=Roseobacter sp. TaxID=1907202 RepID=UPI003299DEBA
MHTKTTLIFDLDGTLIHSAPDLHAALNAALYPLERGPLDLTRVISFIGNGVEKLVERGLIATGGSNAALHRATLDRFLDVYTANGVALTKPYNGVLAQLGGLKDRRVTLGLCTNKPQAPTNQICDALGISTFFDSIVGATPDLPRKPDPAMLHKTIADLGAQPQDVIYVGDSLIDHNTARAAGVEFWLYTQGYLNAPLPNDGCAHRFDHWADPDLFAAVGPKG